MQNWGEGVRMLQEATESVRVKPVPKNHSGWDRHNWAVAGKWIIWTITVVLCLIFASNYGGVVPFVLLKTVIAIPVIGALYCIWIAIHFRFYQNIPEKTVVKGEPVEYSLCMSNEDYIEYCSLQVVYYQNRARLIGVNEEARYLLKRGERKEMCTSMCCKYRGEYEVGVDYFIIRDYLQMIRLQYRPVSAFKVLVLPRIVTWCYEREVFEDKAGSNNARTLRGGEVDVQVRNYVRGDSLNHIHWKASAKMGELMSREDCETRKNQLLLTVDLRPVGENEEERLQYEDMVMEQMVAIIHSCLVRHIPCTVLMQSGTWKQIEITNLEQWKAFYESTAKLTFSANQSLENALQLHPDANRIRYAVFVTHECDSSLQEVLGRQFRQVNTHVVVVDRDQTKLQCV